MKGTAISTHAHQLTRLGLLNCYLVRESDSYTLVDSTITGGGADMIAQARRLAPEPIARILLTHAHADHVGSVDELARELGRVDVAIVRGRRNCWGSHPISSWNPASRKAS